MVNSEYICMKSLLGNSETCNMTFAIYPSFSSKLKLQL